MGGRVRVERDERDPRIGWVVFDHPERRNAISAEMWRAIPGAVDELAQDPEVRAVVMRGAGEVAFVSGADISEFEAQRSSPDAVAEYNRISEEAEAAVARFPKPVDSMR